MKPAHTLIAWLAVLVFAGLITVIVITQGLAAVPDQLYVALGVAIGAASGLSLPTGLAGPSDLLSEIRQLVTDVAGVINHPTAPASLPAPSTPTAPVPPPLTPPAAS